MADTKNTPRCPDCGWEGIATEDTTTEDTKVALAYHRANDCPGSQ